MGLFGPDNESLRRLDALESDVEELREDNKLLLEIVYTISAEARLLDDVTVNRERLLGTLSQLKRRYDVLGGCACRNCYCNRKPFSADYLCFECRRTHPVVGIQGHDTTGITAPAAIIGAYKVLSDAYFLYGDESITLSFDKLEAFLEVPLPDDAYYDEQWWEDPRASHAHAQCWRAIGVAASVDMKADTVTFTIHRAR
jgi:hypothetical protein